MHRFKATVALVLAGASLAAQAGPQSETAGKMSRAQLAVLNESMAQVADGYDVPPKLLVGYRPYFPAPRVIEDREGSCLVRFRIGLSGKAENFSTEGADPMMCSHAVIAMRHWTFSPAMRGGAPAEFDAAIPFDFEFH